MIIFNPGAFIDVIKCACTDTFQAAFPQCVDCFVRTNQTDVLDTPDLPSIVSGMRKICGLESSLLGNVSEQNGQAPSSSPKPTSAPSGGMPGRVTSTSLLGAASITLLTVIFGMV